MEGDAHMWTGVFVQASIEVGIEVCIEVCTEGDLGACG